MINNYELTYLTCSWVIYEKIDKEEVIKKSTFVSGLEFVKKGRPYNELLDHFFYHIFRL